MTDPLFPFEVRLHKDAFSVHKVHHNSVTDPVLSDPDQVKAWHLWRQWDSLTVPTKFQDWQRNADNTDWLFLTAWHIDQEYADGQVPVADADGFLMPGDVEGGESGGGGLHASSHYEGEADELDIFLTARYRLYTIVTGRLATAVASHGPWPLFRANLRTADQTLVPASTLGWPVTAPVLINKWSTKVVLPEEP